EATANRLYGFAQEIRIISVDDPSEWIASGPSSSDLENLVHDAPPYEPSRAASGKDVRWTQLGGFTAQELQKEVLPSASWLIEGVIPGGVSLLVAPPKVGK